MKEVLVLGGGFAGVWFAAGTVRARRAAGAADADMRVTVVDAGDDMVIRPRLYEADPQQMRVPLNRVLGPNGVRRFAAHPVVFPAESSVAELGVSSSTPGRWPLAVRFWHVSNLDLSRLQAEAVQGDERFSADVFH